MKSIKFYKKAYIKLEKYLDALLSKEFVFKSNKAQLLYRYLLSNSFQSQKLLFIHGWGSSMLNWYYQALDRRFAQFDLYFIDLPGHGRNIDFKDLHDANYNTYTCIIEKFIENVIKNKPVIIGHSMGGLISKILYKKNLALKSIYINPVINPISIPLIVRYLINKAIQRSDSFKYKFINKSVRNNFTLEAWSKLLGDKYSHNKLLNDIITIADMYYTKPNAFWGFIYNIDKLQIKRDEFIKLANNELLIISKNDITIPNIFLKEINKSKLNKNIKVLDEGGHCTPRTIPEVINNIIYKYLYFNK